MQKGMMMMMVLIDQIGIFCSRVPGSGVGRSIDRGGPALNHESGGAESRPIPSVLFLFKKSNTRCLVVNGGGVEIKSRTDQYTAL
jgi:hypothetical protein